MLNWADTSKAIRLVFEHRKVQFTDMGNSFGYCLGRFVSGVELCLLKAQPFQLEPLALLRALMCEE